MTPSFCHAGKLEAGIQKTWIPAPAPDSDPGFTGMTELKTWTTEEETHTKFTYKVLSLVIM